MPTSAPNPATAAPSPVVMSAGGAFTTSPLLLTVGILVFVGTTIAFYYYYVVPWTKSKYLVGDNEDGGKGGSHRGRPKTVEVLFFHADWCPHCQKASPVWAEVRQTFDGQTVRGRRLVFVDVDCTDENNAEADRLMKQYHVEGFPTVKMVIDDSVVDFEANITKASLTQFVQQA